MMYLRKCRLSLEETKAYFDCFNCSCQNKMSYELARWTHDDVRVISSRDFPRRGRGWGGGGQDPPTFCKKIIIKLRNTHFVIKGIFDGIRIIDWRTSPEHPNLWLVRFDPISYGNLQNDYLYKTALSRRLLRFHQPGDVVYAQTMESFFIKVLKSTRSYDFLKKLNSMTL